MALKIIFDQEVNLECDGLVVCHKSLDYDAVNYPMGFGGGVNPARTDVSQVQIELKPPGYANFLTPVVIAISPSLINNCSQYFASTFGLTTFPEGIYEARYTVSGNQTYVIETVTPSTGDITFNNGAQACNVSNGIDYTFDITNNTGADLHSITIYLPNGDFTTIALAPLANGATAAGLSITIPFGYYTPGTNLSLDYMGLGAASNELTEGIHSIIPANCTGVSNPPFSVSVTNTFLNTCSSCCCTTKMIANASSDSCCSKCNASDLEKARYAQNLLHSAQALAMEGQYDKALETLTQVQNLCSGSAACFKCC